ncbi:myo-inositol-1(or 4)-monophosphatase [Sulfitobacter pontiacus]|uniref:Myo-inositol-1(Or 4)-monophosphatase n=1 Tax=Sulfitobacter pontiacus TaxID=60137 RepID=A0A1H2ZYJ5_9RHOB|nr:MULTISPECIES: 3'(2'),5'-bisphosphate nucleotidase CysQ [Sulfitobacter]QPO08807.1 3'(2'),5'-bisphosphate nucleotidase CysQ [Sulfitobacter sp. B30-2]SDX22004.1 myo-inositol-1(or 4)-monophosphatase [Sulfitobacter pontiacus]
MPALDDLSLLIEAARRSGEIATSFTGKTAQRWDKPDDAGPVTEADLAVNAMLHQTLTAARPDYGWLSEESDDGTRRLGQRDLFIVDPIDGTRSFIEGSDTWSHSLAIARDGRITAAVVFLPMLDRLYAAAAGAGATLNGQSISVSDIATLPEATVLATKPVMEMQHWTKGDPGFKRAHRPSLAYRLGLVGQGRFDGMVTLRKSWEWDIAAGALIVTEAGGQCTDRTGQPLRFNNPDPRLNGVVAGGDAVHGALLSGLAQTQATP